MTSPPPALRAPPLPKWRGGRNNRKKSLLPGVTRYALTPGYNLSPFQGDFLAFIEGLSILYIHARLTEPIDMVLAWGYNDILSLNYSRDTTCNYLEKRCSTRFNLQFPFLSLARRVRPQQGSTSFRYSYTTSKPKRLNNFKRKAFLTAIIFVDEMPIIPKKFELIRRSL